jgi:hypothetical protein
MAPADTPNARSSILRSKWNLLGAADAAELGLDFRLNGRGWIWGAGDACDGVGGMLP